MQNQRQEHKLKETWEAADYAAKAEQAAKVSQQYHQLISQESNSLQYEFARLNQSLNHAFKKIEHLESAQNADRHSRNRNAMFYGAAGAIVTGLVINLVLSPFQPQQTSSSLATKNQVQPQRQNQQPQQQNQIEPYYPPNFVETPIEAPVQMKKPIKKVRGVAKR